MELELVRTYTPAGTYGKLLYQNELVAYTLELPWKDNRARVSCIPTGRYELLKRYSPRFQWHLQLADVPGRSDILIHPANDAMKELKGCIAPVTMITDTGKGLHSRKGLKKLNAIAYAAFACYEKVFLTIKN